MALTAPYTYQTIYLLKNCGNHEFMDIKKTEDKTETAKDLFLLAFKEAAKRLKEIKEEDGDYTWVNYKSTYAGHLLQGLPASLGIYPGGQSGNPGSRYYDNFIDDWAAGKYYSLNFLQTDEVTSAIIGTQTLTPVSHD